MPTYSTRFFAGNYVGSGLPDVVYTVPALQVVVLRDIEVFSSSADAFNVQLGVPGQTHVVWLGKIATAGTWMQWQGRVVGNAGDTLTVYAASTGTQFMISGYLLGT